MLNKTLLKSLLLLTVALQIASVGLRAQEEAPPTEAPAADEAALVQALRNTAETTEEAAPADEAALVQALRNTAETTEEAAPAAEAAPADEEAPVPPQVVTRETLRPRPTAQPPAPPAPAQTQSSTIADGDKLIGVIDIVDMGAIGVIEMLEEMMGKPFLRMQNIPAVKINFKSRGPMSKADAILALQSLLALNSITVSPVGDKFMKAVPSANAVQQVPELLDYSTLELEPSQQVYGRIFKLNYLTTEEAAAILQAMITTQVGNSVIQFPKAGTVLVTDALLNLQRIERMMLQLDKPGELNKDMLFFKLNYLEASELQKRLENIAQGSLKNRLENNTTFDADDRTNQLIVFTHPSNSEMITDLVDKFDIDVAPPTTTKRYALKHADAEEVVAIIDALISGQKEARDEASGSRGGGAPNTGQPAAQQQQPLGVSAAGEGNKSQQFSDFLTIVEDTRSNSIFATGTPTDHEFLGQLVDDIDVLLAQVQIEVVVAEVTLGDEQVSGLESFNFEYNTTNTAANDISLVPGFQGSETLPAPIALNILNPLSGLSLVGAIDTARNKTNTQVLSAPKIVTTHNREASIIVGQERPVITSTQSDLSTVNTTRSTVQFRDIGIELKVTPLIGSNGVIQLEIEQKVETVVDTVEVDGNPQPIIGQREATSFVSVADGKLVVLGGLQDLQSSKSKNYLPLIGRVPFIGEMLSGRSTNETRTELLIFIRPKVLVNTADATTHAYEDIDAIETHQEVRDYLDTNSFKRVEKPKEPIQKEKWKQRRSPYMRNHPVKIEDAPEEAPDDADAPVSGDAVVDS